MDIYIKGASEIIYHTEDIQKLRAFEESIRDKYRTEEIQKQIDKIYEDENLTEAEREQAVKELKENTPTKLNNFVQWLDEYTNIIANKKSRDDRGMEYNFGRQSYTTMKDLESRISSNLVGGNISVGLTNLGALFQSTGTTELNNTFMGVLQTMNNAIQGLKGNDDNFVYESDFLSSRRGANQAQKSSIIENIFNKPGELLNVFDDFASEVIVRAKYRENIKNGMEHNEALHQADIYARNLMADRSKGALPTIFNTKNPVAKAFTAFQIEPNNMISNYIKDMPREANRTKLIYQCAKLAIGSYAFNELLHYFGRNSDVLPDFIGVASDLIKLAVHNLDSDDENDEEVLESLKSIGADVAGWMPFGSFASLLLTGLGIEGFEDSGRLPLASAMPDLTKIAKLPRAVKNGQKEYVNQTIIDEVLSKPIAYLALPTGGAQIVKTAKGINAYRKGGSYRYNEEGKKTLQYPIEQNLPNLIKSVTLGRTSTREGQKWYEEGYKSLNAKETVVYDESNIDYDTIKGYFAYSSKKGIKKENKEQYVNSMHISEEDKWNLYKYNIISNSERKDGTSQLSDAEYIFKNKMATKKEYMKLYSEADKNGIGFPEKEVLKTLNEKSLSLDTYMKFKIEVKKGNDKKKKEYEKWQKDKLPVSEEEVEKRKLLSIGEKIELIQNDKYTEAERKTIYSEYIKSDEDSTYNYLSEMTNIDIDAYLEYVKRNSNGEFKADDDPKSIIKGKNVNKGDGTSKNKKINYIVENFTGTTALYLIGTSYANTLSKTQLEQLQKEITESGLNAKEQKEAFLKLKDVQELEDGTIEWKKRKK